MTGSEEPTQSYLLNKRNKTSLGHALFEGLVKSNWYGALSVALQDDEAGGYLTYDTMRLGHTRIGRIFIGGSDLYHQAREFKANALGRRIDDDELKLLIEEVLGEELSTHGIVLQWQTRHNWDGVDRVLFMYRKTESIPPAT